MGDFLRNQISRAIRCAPVITADADAATLYEQRWRRQDGKASRSFTVLALDAQMAEEMGGIRLVEKYDESILEWRLDNSRPIDKHDSAVRAVLHVEDPDEQQLRFDTWLQRRDA